MVSPAAEVKSPAFEVRLSPSSRELKVSVSALTAWGRAWGRVELSCPWRQLDAHTTVCAPGKLNAAGERATLTARLTDQPSLDLTISAPSAERWVLSASRAANGWQGKIKIAGGDVARWSKLLTADQPKASAGTLDGEVSLVRSSAGVLDTKGRVEFKGVDFSDSAGEHLGAGMEGAAQFSASQAGERWGWRVSVDWRKGELYWKPIGVAKAGHRLEAHGALQGATLEVERADLWLADVGHLTLTARWDVERALAQRIELNSTPLDLGALHELLVKPSTSDETIRGLSVAGRAAIGWQYADGDTRSLDLKITDTTVAEPGGRYRLTRLNAAIPWVNGRATEGVVSFESAAFGRLPFGRVVARPRMNGYDLTVPELALPILDGSLRMQDLRVRRDADEWVWQYSAELTPISLPQLTRALGWPQMAGTLSGEIPRVRYARRELNVDGALQFKVFEGHIVATNLKLIDPYGATPTLLGNIVMSDLDLEVLTRTFSFGQITGRIDAAVQDMELRGWRPMRFDARVFSSPGEYPRRISQRAVQNISSLGGAGAAAAIQRSVLRIFEQFGYRRIGLSCRLRGNLCEMGGVTDSAQGYVIVQGGGIPAITVMGYNRQVGWEEFIARVKAAIQSNAKPVVQ